MDRQTDTMCRSAPRPTGIQLKSEPSVPTTHAQDESGSTNLPVLNATINKIHKGTFALSSKDRYVGPIQKRTKQHIASSF
jgi:hypothetical protein